LPFVRRIVKDIVDAYARFEAAREKRADLPPRPSPGSDKEEEAFRIENLMQDCEAEILRYQEELNGMGVELKDYRIGLVDFYSRYEGRVIYLCWKFDEPDRLEWWHALEAGFRGRQPITDENRDRFQGMGTSERDERRAEKDGAERR